MLLFFIITALMIAIFAIIFAVQNADIIVVSFLVWQFHGSMALVLLLTFVLGFITSLLVILPKLIKRNFKILEPKKKTEESKDTTQEEQTDKNI